MLVPFLSSCCALLDTGDFGYHAAPMHQFSVQN